MTQDRSHRDSQRLRPSISEVVASKTREEISAGTSEEMLNAGSDSTLFPTHFVSHYSVVIVSGDGATTGARANVAIRLIANNVTAVSSMSAEIGRTSHAHFA